ncbi:MAG: Ig-like domain-containing protein, partial [Clostridia bacterium]|nr:Ig-like domain-containing protein [Clostridia bacterium]
MKRFDTRRLWAALALALILCLAVPALLPARIAPAAQAAGRVKLSKAKATLYVGQTLQLKLNNASGKVAWKSNKKGVAAVTGKGKVTAKKKGTATVTATCGGKKYTCKVTVKPGLTMSST